MKRYFTREELRDQDSPRINRDLYVALRRPGQEPDCTPAEMAYEPDSWRYDIVRGAWVRVEVSHAA